MRFFQARRGLPLLRSKLRRGEAVRVVAFGSSITTQGYYFAAVTAALRKAYPAASISLQSIGRNSFDTILAAFDAQAAVAAVPDLLLVEFAVNDHTLEVRSFIAPALLGILGQIQAVLPQCEFVFVYHGRILSGGPADRLQIDIHNAVADVLGIPSIDVDLLSAALVARGTAVYQGDSPVALTSDGTHQSAAAAELIGVPFAQALLEIVSTDGERPPMTVPALTDVVEAVLAGDDGKLADWIVPQIAFDGETFCRLMMARHLMSDMLLLSGTILSKSTPEAGIQCDTLFGRARRRSPREFIVSGGWGIREEHQRGPMYHREESLVAVEAGATIRLLECARFACFLGFANDSEITVRIDGQSQSVLPPPIASVKERGVWVLAVANRLGEGRHVIEVVAETPLMAFNDIYLIEAEP